MNNCSDLVTIFDRILDRVNKGSENYMTITNYIIRRAEAEEKISSILKSIIPPQYDKTDPITKSFMLNLQNEVDSHTAMIESIQKELIERNNSYTKTMNDRQRSIKSQVEKAKNKAQKAITSTMKAQREVEVQKSKLKDLSGKQLNTQNEYVRRAMLDYQNKSREEVDESLKISAGEIPNIYREFSDFDSLRLRKLHGLTLAFNQLKKNCCCSIIDESKSLEFKLNGFDPVDRSGRYVKRVFDTSIDVVQEDEEIDIYAVAISDYRSADSRDLQFFRGERIKILSQHSSGWYEGVIDDNRRGFFPKTFVILPGDLETRKDAIGAVLLVTKDYNGPNRSDIPLLDGDLVFVDYCSKERCSGKNLRNNQRGYFPLNCLETKFVNIELSMDNKVKTESNDVDWLPEYNDNMELKTNPLKHRLSQLKI